ncbi:MAG: type III secretion inner membrane ring lipoprotein SctJ [Rhabdochlamydiaceae bacterium]|nr:type III secretion inner membrane ring lipoprotein SctJ [Rhabdochlamydiaceae bacterium]
MTKTERCRKFKISTLLKSFLRMAALLLTAFALVGCENNLVIISDVDEREANEIVVFLASRGIPADKIASTSTGPGGGGDTSPKFSISVQQSQSTMAMSILNQNGLPRKKSTNLLDLFAKSGLMSSDKEETIRYQAGLASQIANMIRKIDGVIDADVQLSFPANESAVPTPGAQNTPPQRITAAVYVKHQGILDDPNSHLVTKIKRLVAGSVAGLDVNDVTVISDRSRFTDVSLTPVVEPLEMKGKEYVSIWSIVMNKSSAGRFRVIFFLLTICAIVFALILGWLIWKFYPILKSRGGFRSLLNPTPIEDLNGTIDEDLSDEEEK